MRLIVRFSALVLLALAVTASASGGTSPSGLGDAALLARDPTASERLLESVAARLTRRHPKVRCTTVAEKSDILGVTPFENGRPLGYFLLMPVVCRSLAAFRANPASYDPRACTDNACMDRVGAMVQSIQSVSHESYHVLGFAGESTAECYGMQSLWYVANKLGASVRLSESLAAFYAKYLYPSWRTSPYPQYWSAQCHDGGKLDLRPQTHGWPS
jgi:hypothetical protein